MINNSPLDASNNLPRNDENVFASIYVAPVILFFFLVIGWRFFCVPIFRRYDIDYFGILKVRIERNSKITTSDGKVDPVAMRGLRAWTQSTVITLICILTFFFLAHVHLGTITIQTAVVMSYGTAILCTIVFFYVRGPIYSLRCFFRESIYRCFVPLEGRETPFIEVLLADSFCSLAKPLYQVIMGMVMLFASVGVESPDWNSLQAGSKARSVIPYIFWALPFYLRARQTIISAVASEGPKRVTHVANFVKYSLNFFVIFFAFQWASSMNAGITENQASSSENALSMDDRASETLAYEAMWIISSVINEIYTVMWDICMDWGLGGRPSALRCTLLFPRKWYYVAIVFDFVGRSLWSARFSSLVMNNLGGVELVMASECYEVARRLMWIIFRIEWELIKTRHHIPVFRKSHSELTYMSVSRKTTHERLSEMGTREETERLGTVGYDDGFGSIGRPSYSSTDNIELKNQLKTTKNNLASINAMGGPRSNAKNLSYSMAKAASSLGESAMLRFNKPWSSLHDDDDDDHIPEKEIELQELIPSLNNGFHESLSTASMSPRCIGAARYAHSPPNECCDHPSSGRKGTISTSSCPLHARRSPSLSPLSSPPSTGGTATTAVLVLPKRNEDNDEESGITSSTKSDP